jgi:hypothetical protein
LAFDTLLPTGFGKPLIHAILFRNWPEVIKLAKQSPSMARTLFCYQAEDGPIVLLPLHLCLRKSPPVCVVEHEIKAYLLSIRICEYSEFPMHNTFYYPMHIACGASGGAIELEIVKVLLDVFPDAAMIKDRTIRLPLHHALARNASPKCILTLLESFPWSASVPDTNGWFPLHTACAMGYSALVIRNLLQCCPEVMERQQQNCYSMMMVSTVPSLGRISI